MNIIEWKQEKINGVLSTFDRMIIKGYSLQLSNPSQMGYFLSHNDVLLKDFGDYAENITKSLCSHIENIAKENNRPYQFIYGNDTDKATLAKQILEENPIDNGLICIFSNIEVCSTMNVIKNGETKKLELKWNLESVNITIFIIWIKILVSCILKFNLDSLLWLKFILMVMNG